MGTERTGWSGRCESGDTDGTDGTEMPSPGDSATGSSFRIVAVGRVAVMVSVARAVSGSAEGAGDAELGCPLSGGDSGSASAALGVGGWPELAGESL